MDKVVTTHDKFHLQSKSYQQQEDRMPQETIFY